MYAALVSEPFNVPLSEIAKLTDYQIFSIYFWPRNKDGKFEDVDGQQTLREIVDPRYLRLQFIMMETTIGGKSQEEADLSFRRRFPGWSI